MKRLNILIWHVHSSYLYYLTQTPHNFYMPSKPDRKGAYKGRLGKLPWGNNVFDVPFDLIKTLDFDCIIFQQPAQYQEEQYVILSPEQRKLPKIYLEHDPPIEHPTNTRHFLDDPNVLMVHVTHFNSLMWDAGRTPRTVIEHGVVVPPNLRYKGNLEKGIVVINHLKQRGRCMGSDVYLQARHEVPLDLVGKAAEDLEGGLAEAVNHDLLKFVSQYRFFFNPIRYSSLSLAVCEAMAIGMPIIGLATTEMVRVIKNDVSGYIDTRTDTLIDYMKFLLENPKEAKRLGQGARRYATEHFAIERFIDDWNAVFHSVTGYLNSSVKESAADSDDNELPKSLRDRAIARLPKTSIN